MKVRLLRVLLSGAILFLMASQSVKADNVYATIKGVVTDQTGAVVSGAQMTATNTATGIVYTTKTRETGSYEFLQLPVGTYTVSVSKQGFKGVKSVGISLVVNQIYELPVKLAVGAASETVEVRANAVQVETTDIQQKTVIESQTIVDLPLLGRNFVQLSQLAPGVMASSDRFGSNYATNGSQTQQSNYLINGTDSNDIALNTPGFIPSPDAIQEFNLITSTINPEYGRNSGGILNAVIKSGTNKWHGSAFDFYRDTFLNARNFFTAGPQQPIFHQNQFGGTVGGPVVKDHTFFFLSYQGTYNAVATPTLTTVFSPAQRSGIFSGIAGLPTSGLCTALGGTTPCSAVPLVGEDSLTHPALTPYGALFPTGHIPAVDFNAISKGLMNKFVPLPNASSNGFSFSPVNTNKTDQGIAKIDHSFNANNQIWGIFAENYNRGTQGLPFTGANLPGFGTFSTANTKEITVAYTHTFNNSTLNELRLAFHRLNFMAVEPAQLADPSTFGFTNIKVQNPQAAQLPVIALTGLFTLGFSTNGPQPRIDTNYQLTDNFTKIVGKHSLKFGFDVRRFQVDNPFFNSVDGSFGFGGNGGFSTGDPGADFLLGTPDSYSQGSGAVINARAYEYYAYGQDQWKIKNNLTLTLGAGYEIDTPYSNTQYSGKAFNCFRPGAQSTVFPTAPAGLLFPGDGGFPGSEGCTNSGTKIKYGHLGPRFGFAYAPGWGGRITNGSSQKTSIRGGFGVYFNRYEEETALQNLGAPPFGITSAGAGDVGFSPGFANPWVDVCGAPCGNVLPPGFPANKFPFIPPAPGAPVDFTFFESMSINTNSPSLSTPYSMNFNLNIEREFPGRTVLSVGYVGALGRHLYRAYEGNPITLAGAALCAADAFCRGHRNVQHIDFPAHSLVDGSIFGSVGTQFTDGTSRYNAFQVKVNKGLTHGLELITSYTWSHSIDNASGFESSGFFNRGTNPFFPGLNVGDSDFDARQRFVAGYVYHIPSLHHMANWAPEKVFGGWRLSGISTFQTGFPINIGDSGFRSLTCDALVFYACWDNANQVAGSITTLDPRNSSFKSPIGGNIRQNYWFDPASFKRNALGTFGNVGRNSVHGPGINNVDFALAKETAITERLKFEMGIEAFNLFNHAQFNNPNGNVGSSNFGRITSAAAGRIVQLRAKVNF
jgi:hypothetical protein